MQPTDKRNPGQAAPIPSRAWNALLADYNARQFSTRPLAGKADLHESCEGSQTVTIQNVGLYPITAMSPVVIVGQQGEHLSIQTTGQLIMLAKNAFEVMNSETDIQSTGMYGVTGTKHIPKGGSGTCIIGGLALVRMKRDRLKLQFGQLRVGEYEYQSWCRSWYTFPDWSLFGDPDNIATATFKDSWIERGLVGPIGHCKVVSVFDARKINAQTPRDGQDSYVMIDLNNRFSGTCYGQTTIGFAGADSTAQTGVTRNRFTEIGQAKQKQLKPYVDWDFIGLTSVDATDYEDFVGDTGMSRLLDYRIYNPYEFAVPSRSVFGFSYDRSLNRFTVSHPYAPMLFSGITLGEAIGGSNEASVLITEYGNAPFDSDERSFEVRCRSNAIMGSVPANSEVLVMKSGTNWEIIGNKCQPDPQPGLKVGGSNDTSLPAEGSNTYGLWYNNDGTYLFSGGAWVQIQAVTAPGA